MYFCSYCRSSTLASTPQTRHLTRQFAVTHTENPNYGFANLRVNVTNFWKVRTRLSCVKNWWVVPLILPTQGRMGNEAPTSFQSRCVESARTQLALSGHSVSQVADPFATSNSARCVRGRSRSTKRKECALSTVLNGDPLYHIHNHGAFFRVLTDKAPSAWKVVG